MSNIAKAYLTIPGASVTPEEREFLKAVAGVVSRVNPHPLIVNIGVWHGATLACLRAGAPHARIIGVDIDFTTNRLLFEDFEPLHGDSREVYAQVPDHIDLLFIDGDHHYEVVREDIANWLPKVRPGGIVVFHDYTPEPIDMEATPHLEGVRRAIDEWAEVAGDGWTVMHTPASLRAYQKPGADDGVALPRKPRIFLMYPGHKVSTYEVADGYYNALKEMGCIVQPYQYHDSLMFYSHALEHWAGLNKKFTYDEDDWMRLSSEMAVLEAVRFGPDVVVTFCGFAMHRSAFEMLGRNLGLPIALCLTESPYLDETQRELIEHAHLSMAFTNDLASVDYLNQNSAGVPVTYLPHAYDHTKHMPMAVGDEYKSDACFIGTLYDERKVLFDGVDWTGINELIITPRINKEKSIVEGAIDNTETVKYYNGTKVAISSHRTSCGVFNDELVQLPQDASLSLGPRSYEIAACGAFQVSDPYRAELLEVFGETVPTFTTSAELERLIRHYIAHDDERQELARQQHEAVQPHSFRARAEQILLPAITSEV